MLNTLRMKSGELSGVESFTVRTGFPTAGGSVYLGNELIFILLRLLR